MKHIEQETFATRVRANRRKLASELRTRFDYIVCGAGTSGCVVAARRAADPNIHVLVIEAGETDESAVTSRHGLAATTRIGTSTRRRRALHREGMQRCSTCIAAELRRGPGAPIRSTAARAAWCTCHVIEVPTSLTADKLIRRRP